MTTRYDRMRAAADAIDDLQRLRHGTHVGCEKCAEKHAASEQLRADANELAALEAHLRTLRATTWGDAGQYVTDVANRIRGEK